MVKLNTCLCIGGLTLSKVKHECRNHSCENNCDSDHKYHTNNG
ncbi:hypothetical protein HTG_04325 [Natrinema mahii]|nr:hypothetical protein HTG_04325 [Natrinema mahii]